METPLCGNKQENWTVFACVSVASLALGAAVGFLSSGQPNASLWIATKNVASVRTTSLPLNLRLQLQQAQSVDALLDSDIADISDDEIVEIRPEAVARPSFKHIFGFGALAAASILAVRSVIRPAQQPKARQEFDLEAMWSMASSSGAGKTIRIATRKSPLAMWQAEFIQSELERLWPGITIELQPMSTKGDKILDSPLAKVGGKGLFVKELETALLEGRSDIAVHSTKDVPMELPDGLVLGIICKRHDPCDAIVFPKGSTLKSLDDLPKGARVGTSSLRRQCQLLLKRPDLQFLELRGNVNTRLAKLDSGDYDAIILAAAGLKRLGFNDRVLPGETNIIDPDAMLPAAGQGALSIELRIADKDVAALLEPLHHIPDAVTVCCERAMNRRLSGGCQVPISGFAQLKDGNLRMEARVGSVTGKGPLIIKHKTIPFTLDKPWPELQKESEALGVDVAEMLLAAGAQAYLDEAYTREDVGVGLAASQK